MPDPIPERIGRFQIQEVLGASVYGRLFAALDPVNGRPFAIKLLVRPSTIPRFEHPNIVEVLETGEHNGKTYIVREWLGGHNLAQWLESEQPPFAAKLRIIEEIAGALEQAHALGIIHGDLKFSNIIVQHSGVSKLTDFGLNPGANAASDVFDFGSLCYDLIAGRAADAPAKDHRQPLRNIAFACLPGLERIIATVIHDDPHLRYPDMTAFAADLRLLHTSPLDALLIFAENEIESGHIPYAIRLLQEAARLYPADRVIALRLRAVDRMRPVMEEAITEKFYSVEYLPQQTRIGDAAPSQPVPVNVRDENVQFTVFRPRVIAPLKWYTLLAFAHLSEPRPDEPANTPDPVQEVQRQAEQILGEQREQYQELSQDSAQAIPREGEITFVPEVPGIAFNPERVSFLWQEPVHRAEFRMRAAAALDSSVARGRISVFLGSIIVAEVSLAVRVDRQPLESRTFDTEASRPYRNIFPSYSHKDVMVVEEFERHARAVGDEYLRDVIHLRTGEQWDRRLTEMIGQADVFQLFWSRNSMRSEFVEREWRCALGLRRPHFIRPVYWEEPLPQDDTRGLPPPDLRELHFQRVYPAVLAPSLPAPAARPAAPAPPTWAPQPVQMAGEFTRTFPAASTPPPPREITGEFPTVGSSAGSPSSSPAPVRTASHPRARRNILVAVACIALLLLLVIFLLTQLR